MATLGNTTSEKVKKIDIVQVVEHADVLSIPEGMSLEGAIAALKQKQVFDETVVAINAPIAGFVFEAAHAFYKAMEAKYGWVNGIPTPSFWGSRPPETLTVETGRGTSVQVPWGRFEVPGIEGFLQTSLEPKGRDGKEVYTFTISGQVKRKYEKAVNAIVEATRLLVNTASIYRGTAFRIRLKDDDGYNLEMPKPDFLELNAAIEDELVFPEQVGLDVATNLFTPIEKTSRVREAGIPLKRGVLLAGPYGVGKTMVGHVTALKAVRHGWTYIVCERSDELAEVLRLASMYRPAVVFCEDIDRVMSGERNVSVDHILNVIDGVESKSAELVIVLTTNDIDNITPALLRPGRLDAVIYIDAPDAEAAERLARQYARGLIPENEDISGAANHLAGRIPAIIRETVERAKLVAIGLTPDGEKLHITNEALLHAATRMDFQLQKLEPKVPDARSDVEKAAGILSDAIKTKNADVDETVAVAVTPMLRRGNGHREPVRA